MISESSPDPLELLLFLFFQKSLLKKMSSPCGHIAIKAYLAQVKVLLEVVISR
jgi:hypothetical protein